MADHSVTDIAKEAQISRTSVYAAKNQVIQFAQSLDECSPDSPIVEITEEFLERMVLSLSLDCHSSLEGIQRFAESILGKHLSIGKISTIIKEAAVRAQQFDDKISLEAIKQGANDEIFQCNTPILTGIDTESTYIYLLDGAGDRSADTWELYMEDRKEHGLDLMVTIHDAGTGLMSGIPKAFPHIAVQLDIFHALRYIGVEISKLERRAYSLIDNEAKLEERSKGKRPRQKTREHLSEIRPKVREAVCRYDLFAILFGWLREIIGFSGYGLEDSLTLATFILDEMNVAAEENRLLLESIATFRRAMPQTLSFLSRFQRQLETVSEEKGIPPEILKLMYRQRALAPDSEESNQLVYQLVKLLRNDYDKVQAEFENIMEHTKKASSLVENLNSRIRVYMNLKRVVPKDYFVLLKVYLNLKKYRRSRKSERIGKSPLELMSGKEQPEFLEALGY